MPDSPLPLASLRRRLLALTYEALLLAAVVLAAAVVLVPATQLFGPALARPLLQVALLAAAGGYLVWQWCRGGQTLAMKTWRIRLARADGAPLDPRRAVLRFVIAVAGMLALGAGFAWALIDRERQFLHDRVAGTRIVYDQGERRKEKGES